MPLCLVFIKLRDFILTKMPICTFFNFFLKSNIELQTSKFYYLVNGRLDLLNGQCISSKPLYLASIKYDVFYP